MKHIDYQEFIELYNKGLSDTEICESMKYKIQTVS